MPSAGNPYANPIQSKVKVLFFQVLPQPRSRRQESWKRTDLLKTVGFPPSTSSMSTLATLVLWVRGTAVSFGVTPKEKVPWLKELHLPPKGAPSVGKPPTCGIHQPR